MGAERSVRQEEWARIRGCLQAEFGDGVFRSWLRPMTLADLGPSRISIQLPTRFMRDRVQGRYGERICALWRESCPELKEIGFEVNPVLANGSAAPPPPRPAAAANAAGDWLQNAATPLEPDLTFDRFVVGESNKLAYRICYSAAHDDAPRRSPLFLFGDVGLGKTHLMQALALKLAADNPGLRVLYQNADDFRRHFLEALETRNTILFKERIRSVGVLMVDDVHLLARSTSTQEEFFHTINALANRNCLIVVSGNRSPVDLEGIQERIRSRLSTGVAAEILPAATDDALRCAIVESKAREVGLDLPAEVAAFLAERIVANVRVLQGALHRLDAHLRHFGGEVTIERAEQVLSDLLPARELSLTVEAIKEMVCQCFNIRLAEMDSPRRARAVARPRQVAMYLAKQLTDLSLPEIGRKFGRDHSTVLYGVRRVERLIEEDDVFAEEVAALRDKLAP